MNLEQPLDNHVSEELRFKTVSGSSKIRNSCDHLNLLSSDLPHIPSPDTPCSRCHHPWENWLCLHCNVVLCGRFVNQHMLQHNQQTNHCLVLGYGDLSVWCYTCNAYLNVQVIPQLQSLYQTAYKVKFGETLPFLTAEQVEVDEADGCENIGSNQGEGKKRRKRRGKGKKNSLTEGETSKESNETEKQPEGTSTRGAEGALGVLSSSCVNECNENDSKINYKQCLCGQEAIVKISESSKNKNRKYYSCKENKCEFFEWCIDDEARAVPMDTMLPENEALGNQGMNNLAYVAELRAEIRGLTARIKMLESNLDLMKMMTLMNILYGLMLMVVTVVVLFKV